MLQSSGSVWLANSSQLLEAIRPTDEAEVACRANSFRQRLLPRKPRWPPRQLDLRIIFGE